MQLDFARDGAELHTGLAEYCLPELQSVFPAESFGPGLRMTSLGEQRRLLGPGSPINSAVAKRIGLPARPVRAIVFDKSEANNWALGWHQDRTICVRKRTDTPNFGPWAIKQGVHHVEPPSQLLARMATVRIHIDEVDCDNAPLKIALESHLLGRVEEAHIPACVEQSRQATCLAAVGDVWLYSTLILHASDRAAGLRRRVLQIDYAAEELPGELEWLSL